MINMQTGCRKVYLSGNIPVSFQQYYSTISTSNWLKLMIRYIRSLEWSGGAVVLGKLPFPRRPSKFDNILRLQ